MKFRAVVLAGSLLAVMFATNARAECATIATRDEVTVRLGTVTIAFHEEAVCAGGDPAARLLITEGETVLCDRTDVNPGFDPFLFGAGIHNLESDACGADVSVESTNYPTAVVDSGRGTVLVAKDDAQTAPFGRYWFPGAVVQIPSHTPAVFGRGFRV